ncbi:MAG TPA: cupin domain-containing protein [Gemmatimonadaceae bacterium]
MSRLRTHPKDRFAELVRRIDLTEAAAALRAEQHAPVAGHRQIVLVRRGSMSLILFAFEANGVLKEHRADGEVVIQALTGRIEVTAGGSVTVLEAGQALSLASGETHSVRAPEVSDMLLTVCRDPATHS